MQLPSSGYMHGLFHCYFRGNQLRPESTTDLHVSIKTAPICCFSFTSALGQIPLPSACYIYKVMQTSSVHTMELLAQLYSVTTATTETETERQRQRQRDRERERTDRRQSKVAGSMYSHVCIYTRLGFDTCVEWLSHLVQKPPLLAISGPWPLYVVVFWTHNAIT